MTSPKGKLARHTLASTKGWPTLFHSLLITPHEITR